MTHSTILKCSVTWHNIHWPTKPWHVTLLLYVLVWRYAMTYQKDTLLTKLWHVTCLLLIHNTTEVWQFLQKEKFPSPTTVNILLIRKNFFLSSLHWHPSPTRTTWNTLYTSHKNYEINPHRQNSVDTLNISLAVIKTHLFYTHKFA